MTMTSKPTCKVIRGGASYAVKQGLAYFNGISAQSVGAGGLCLHLVTLPPGGRAKAHRHAEHETAIYILSGRVTMYFGEDLEEELFCMAGDFMYIPPGAPHLPVNISTTESCSALVARTDPDEEERGILLPELDARVPAWR